MLTKLIGQFVLWWLVLSVSHYVFYILQMSLWFPWGGGGTGGRDPGGCRKTIKGAGIAAQGKRVEAGRTWGRWRGRETAD